MICKFTPGQKLGHKGFKKCFSTKTSNKIQKILLLCGINTRRPWSLCQVAGPQPHPCSSQVWEWRGFLLLLSHKTPRPAYILLKTEIQRSLHLNSPVGNPQAPPSPRQSSLFSKVTGPLVNYLERMTSTQTTDHALQFLSFSLFKGIFPFNHVDDPLFPKVRETSPGQSDDALGAHHAPWWPHLSMVWVGRDRLNVLFVF